MASRMKVKSESGSHELPQRPQVNEVANNNDLILRTYLDRQGRNEYITLASQIGYDGNIVLQNGKFVIVTFGRSSPV